MPLDPKTYAKVKADLFRKVPIYPQLMRQEAAKQYTREQQALIEQKKQETEQRIQAEAQARSARESKQMAQQIAAHERAYKSEVIAEGARSSGSWVKITDSKVETMGEAATSPDAAQRMGYRWGTALWQEGKPTFVALPDQPSQAQYFGILQEKLAQGDYTGKTARLIKSEVEIGGKRYGIEAPSWAGGFLKEYSQQARAIRAGYEAAAQGALKQVPEDAFGVSIGVGKDKKSVSLEYQQRQIRREEARPIREYGNFLKESLFTGKPSRERRAGMLEISRTQPSRQIMGLQEESIPQSRYAMGQMTSIIGMPADTKKELSSGDYAGRFFQGPTKEELIEKEIEIASPIHKKLLQLEKEKMGLVKYEAPSPGFINFIRPLEAVPIGAAQAFLAPAALIETAFTKGPVAAGKEAIFGTKEWFTSIPSRVKGSPTEVLSLGGELAGAYAFGKASGAAYRYAPRPKILKTPEYTGVGVSIDKKIKPVIGIGKREKITNVPDVKFDRVSGQVIPTEMPVKVSTKALMLGKFPAVKSVAEVFDIVSMNKRALRVIEGSRKEISLGPIAYEKNVKQIADIEGYFISKTPLKRLHEPTGTDVALYKEPFFAPEARKGSREIDLSTAKPVKTRGFEITKPFMESIEFTKPAISAMRLGYRKLKVGEPSKKIILGKFDIGPKYETVDPSLLLTKKTFKQVPKQITERLRVAQTDEFMPVDMNIPGVKGAWMRGLSKAPGFDKWADLLGEQAPRQTKPRAPATPPVERFIESVGSFKKSGERFFKPSEFFAQQPQQKPIDIEFGVPEMQLQPKPTPKKQRQTITIPKEFKIFEEALSKTTKIDTQRLQEFFDTVNIKDVPVPVKKQMATSSKRISRQAQREQFTFDFRFEKQQRQPRRAFNEEIKAAFGSGAPRQRSMAKPKPTASDRQFFKTFISSQTRPFSMASIAPKQRSKTRAREKPAPYPSPFTEAFTQTMTKQALQLKTETQPAFKEMPSEMFDFGTITPTPIPFEFTVPQPQFEFTITQVSPKIPPPRTSPPITGFDRPQKRGKQPKTTKQRRHDFFGYGEVSPVAPAEALIGRVRR